MGLHPNTVRLYEEWGILQKPERKANGYRVYTDMHIDQIYLVKRAFQIEVLQAGLRKKIIEAVKLSAECQFEEAISCADEYIAIAMTEMENAKEAVDIVNELLEKQDYEEAGSLKRAEAANALGLTIDTIRNWEMNGLIKIKRRENGYRVYNAEDIKRLKIIRSLRCANYSLSAILRMLNALDCGNAVNTLKVLNTPREEEDIILACDKLIVSLEQAKKNAGQVRDMLIEMKNKYSNPPL